MLPLNLISFALATLLVAASVDGSTIDDSQQKSALEQLRVELENELTADYMKEDYYLANWLKKHFYNVQNTPQSVRKHFQYLEQQNFSHILDENWDDLRTKFPYTRNTFDKSGRPVLYHDVGKWDLASYLSSEPSAYDRYLRYHQMIHQESEHHVRQLREQGRDVSQYTVLYNLGGFSVSKHACMQCMFLTRDLANVMVSYGPGNIEKTVLVNVPYPFKMVYSLLGDATQTNLQLYGQDQSEVENMLLNYIDRDQFPQGILEELDQKDNTEGLITWNKEL